MTEKSIKRVHLIYGIVLSVLLVTLAVLFAVMCISIFKTTGEIGAFTRERVAEHFSKIAAFVYITIAAIIFGGILNTVAPVEKKRLKGASNDSIILRRLYGKLTHLSPEGGDKIERQRIIRFAMIIASLVFTLVAIIGSFIYLCVAFDTPGENINAEVVSGWLSILWFFVGPFVYLVVTAYICKRSIKKELEIVKDEFKSTKATTDECEIDNCIGTFTKLTNDIDKTIEQAKAPKNWHKGFSIGIKITVACLIIVFVIVGAINGGIADVAEKANRICSECIGLG